jgi:hypothetical protein
MAKKRLARKEVKAKGKKGVAAYVLLFVAVLFLYVNSIFAVLARKQISLLLEKQYGIPVSEIALVTYAVIWFTIGTISWITNYKIDKTGNRNQKWMLFVMSIITMIAGRVESGVVMLIASILYLRRK